MLQLWGLGLFLWIENRWVFLLDSVQCRVCYKMKLYRKCVRMPFCYVFAVIWLKDRIDFCCDNPSKLGWQMVVYYRWCAYNVFYYRSSLHLLLQLYNYHTNSPHFSSPLSVLLTHVFFDNTLCSLHIDYRHYVWHLLISMVTKTMGPLLSTLNNRKNCTKFWVSNFFSCSY